MEERYKILYHNIDIHIWHIYDTIAHTYRGSYSDHNIAKEDCELLNAIWQMPYNMAKFIRGE